MFKIGMIGEDMKEEKAYEEDWNAHKEKSRSEGV